MTLFRKLADQEEDQRSLNSTSGKVVLWSSSWSASFLNKVTNACLNNLYLDLLACHMASSMGFHSIIERARRDRRCIREATLVLDEEVSNFSNFFEGWSQNSWMAWSSEGLVQQQERVSSGSFNYGVEAHTACHMTGQ